MLAIEAMRTSLPRGCEIRYWIVKEPAYCIAGKCLRSECYYHKGERLKNAARRSSPQRLQLLPLERRLANLVKELFQFGTFDCSSKLIVVGDRVLDTIWCRFGEF